MKMAPAWRRRSTMTLSAGGMKSFRIGEPMVIRIPLTGARSLTASGKPCSGPIGAPRASCASRASASTAAQETCRDRMAPASATASIMTMSEAAAVQSGDAEVMFGRTVAYPDEFVSVATILSGTRLLGPAPDRDPGPYGFDHAEG